MHEELTVNQIVQQYQKMSVEELSNLAPAEICAHLVVLSSRLWTIGSEILKTEGVLAKKWIEIRQDTKTDKMADELIKITEEYKEAKQARWAEKTVIELIRSLKKILKSKEIEYQNL